MAYTDNDIYLLRYCSHLIGEVTAIHHGLGWLRGDFKLSSTDQMLLSFIECYLDLEDLWGEDQNIYDQALQNIASKFGSELVDSQNWSLTSKLDGKIRILAEVPFIDHSFNSISWRE